MRKTVDGCVGCGQLPCFHCTETMYICDQCGAEECETLYILDDDEVCEDCFDAYLADLKFDAEIKE